MIRFYLGEEPLLASVPTWVLADAEQWAQVRDRLHELVVEPVAGYGGRGDGGRARPARRAELALLQAEVAAAPHRFVAREPRGADDRCRPSWTARCSRGTSTCGCSRWPGRRRATALPAPLTRVAAAPQRRTGASGGAKDTWSSAAGSVRRRRASGRRAGW